MDLSYGMGKWVFVKLMVLVGLVSGVDGCIVEIYLELDWVMFDGV